MSQMKQIPCFVSMRQQKQFNLFNHVVKNKKRYDVTDEIDFMLRHNALAKTDQSVQLRC